MMGKYTTKKLKAKIAHYRPRHKGLNLLPEQVTSHGFAERIRMQSPQDHSSGSEPVYCSVMELQTDTTDIIEMNNDNYPEAHKVFDSWDSRDHRRRPHLPSSSPPTSISGSHRHRRTLPHIGVPELSTPYPTARSLNQVDPPAPGVLSNFPGAVEYPSPFRGYPQGAQSSSLQLVAPQYPQHGMDLGGSPTNFLIPAQNVAFADRPAWEQGSLFHSYDQPQAQSFLDNPPLSFSTSIQDNTLTLNQGGDFYDVEYNDNISHGGEPLQFYSETIPLAWSYQENLNHSSPPQISPLEINDNLLNATRNPHPEDWNQQALYQYPPQDSFYRH